MNLNDYLKKDPRLAKVNDLAKDCYGKAALKVHNYDHALWVTDKIIRIGETEKHSNISLLIVASLMHDSGVSRGQYKNHSMNGGKNIRDYLPDMGFDKGEIGEIAVAIEQHNSWEHFSDTSKCLYDADTLNKSGAHGLDQCRAVGEELDLTFVGMTNRFLSYTDKLVKKGFYTKTAKAIDIEMGNGELGGLELTFQFWKKADELLKQGSLSEKQIVKKLGTILRIEYDY